jgi:tetratricopeptide (TPR) repeat protein
MVVVAGFHWRNINFRLLGGSVSDYRPTHQAGLMSFVRIVALFIAIVTGATVAHGNVPIIVNTPGHQRAVMNLCSKASHQLRDGDIAGAKHNVDAALRIDPKLWPALYIRAQIFRKEGKYDLAIQDCNEALRQYPGLVEASLLRASIKVRLGKYAEALKEFNYLISLHPRPVTLARALSDRAWFYATCPDSSFRNGQQAVKDAKAACSIMQWKDEDMIDTLAAAYAEAGDFDSAVQYVSQALAMKGISSESAKVFREHLQWFQQRKRIPASK